jgi:hypothetical protein
MSQTFDTILLRSVAKLVLVTGSQLSEHLAMDPAQPGPSPPVKLIVCPLVAPIHSIESPTRT